MSSKRRLWIIGAAGGGVLLLAGAGWLLLSTSDWYRIGQLRRALARGDFRARQKAMWRLGTIGGARAAEVASSTLRNEQNPHVREAAAYALWKMQAREYYELVRAVAVEERPCEVQAKMAMYAAQLGGERAKPWLREVSGRPPSWLGLGAVLGRLELGDLEADRILFDYLKGPDKMMQAVAATRLTKWIELMAEAIGRPARLPAKPERGITAEQAEELIRWWRRHVTAKLLLDNVIWRKGSDPSWRRMARLMGARGKAIRFLQID